MKRNRFGKTEHISVIINTGNCQNCKGRVLNTVSSSAGPPSRKRLLSVLAASLLVSKAEGDSNGKAGFWVFINKAIASRQRVATVWHGSIFFLFMRSCCRGGLWSPFFYTLPHFRQWWSPPLLVPGWAAKKLSCSCNDCSTHLSLCASK